MGYKEKMTKALLSGSRFELDSFVGKIEYIKGVASIKEIDKQHIKARFTIDPVYGEYLIKKEYIDGSKPIIIDIEFTVWGKAKPTIYQIKTISKDAKVFIDKFTVHLENIVLKAIREHKDSLKPVVNQFGRKIIQLPVTATKQDIEKLVLSGFEVQVKNKNDVIYYGVSQIEVDLFYSKKSA